MIRGNNHHIKIRLSIKFTIISNQGKYKASLMEYVST